MLASVVGAGLAGVTALLAYSAINEATKETVDREIDLQWMQASIDAMPKCHYLAYGSVSRTLHFAFPGCLPGTSSFLLLVSLASSQRRSPISLLPAGTAEDQYWVESRIFAADGRSQLAKCEGKS